jgi:hypothetical protein
VSAGRIGVSEASLRTERPESCDGTVQSPGGFQPWKALEVEHSECVREISEKF